MANSPNDVSKSFEKSQGRSIDLVERLFEVTKPGAVFSEPVAAGEYTVITASEVSVGVGSGFGVGGGSRMGESDSEEQATSPGGEATGVGGGGGGGGWAGGRPVAIISVGPAGVQIIPVFDRTKIGLALLTTLGSMFVFMNRMRRLGRR